jgi:fructose-bisphosphate aldolase / 2-amino-3,7-dideoxy-D-threo-hept-6-ulosonate synthase
MTITGTDFRLSRLFDKATGTTVVVPMDQGTEDVFPELADPGAMIAGMADAGVNGFLMRRGMARRYFDAFAGTCAWVERITSQSATALNDMSQYLVSTPTDALHHGADAVVMTCFAGHDDARWLPEFGRLADECHRIGMPFIAEPFPVGGPDAIPYEGPYTLRDMLLTVRIACEEGADVIKTWYPRSSQELAEIVAYSQVPVVVAGGPKANSQREVLEFVKGSIDGGAAGTVIGRKIWQSPDPAKMCRAIVRIVRQGASVEEAAAELA